MIQAQSEQGLVGNFDPGGFVSFAIYILGFLVLIDGLAYRASLAGISRQWIIVGALVLFGIGLAMGATRTRQKDPPV